jgi:hypothetical protein
LGLGQRVLKLGALARWLKLLKALHCYNGKMGQEKSDLTI